MIELIKAKQYFCGILNSFQSAFRCLYVVKAELFSEGDDAETNDEGRSKSVDFTLCECGVKTVLLILECAAVCIVEALLSIVESKVERRTLLGQAVEAKLESSNRLCELLLRELMGIC